MRCDWDERSGLIIIVDDDEAVRRGLTLLLASYGWDVAAFASAEALLAAGMPPGCRSCLVVDQDMPGLTGIDLIAALRAEGHLQPAILMSGIVDGRRRIALAAEEMAGTAFLHKPIDPDRFLSCVRRSLEGLSPIDSGQSQDGPVRQ